MNEIDLNISFCHSVPIYTINHTAYSHGLRRKLKTETLMQIKYISWRRLCKLVSMFVLNLNTTVITRMNTVRCSMIKSRNKQRTKSTATLSKRMTMAYSDNEKHT